MLHMVNFQTNDVDFGRNNFILIFSRYFLHLTDFVRPQLLIFDATIIVLFE